MRWTLGAKGGVGPQLGCEASARCCRPHITVLNFRVPIGHISDAQHDERDLRSTRVASPCQLHWHTSPPYWQMNASMWALQK